MTGYVKRFVAASLVYFAAGALLGLHAATGEMFAGLTFAHAHLNLLGFMSMMIYGVGYFIIPRFNATTLAWPRLLPYHFWIANLGLVTMVSTYSFSRSQGPAVWIFRIAAFSQLVSVFMFSIHMLVTMYGRKMREGEAAEAGSQGEAAEKPLDTEYAVPRIHPDMRVGEILERWPGAVPILVEGGLTPLGDPRHAELVKGMPVTLRMACAKHGGDPDVLARCLNEYIGSEARPAVGEDGRGGTPALPTKSSIIRDVLAAHPETEAVFRKHYGEGCFSCPGQAFESIAQSALMHDIDPEKLLADIHRAIRRS